MKRIAGWILLIGGGAVAIWQASAAIFFAAFFYGWPSVENGDTYRMIAVALLGLLIAAIGLALVRGARVRASDRR